MFSTERCTQSCPRLGYPSTMQGNTLDDLVDHGRTCSFYELRFREECAYAYGWTSACTNAAASGRCKWLTMSISLEENAYTTEKRESIFQELILRLIVFGNHREALDELELYVSFQIPFASACWNIIHRYLPSFPFQDNPVLHVYAGMISLYLSQPSNETSDCKWFLKTQL